MGDLGWICATQAAIVEIVKGQQQVAVVVCKTGIACTSNLNGAIGIASGASVGFF